MTVTEDWSLAEVRDWLRDNVDTGVQCPACTQHAKVYRRKINSGMAHALIVMHRHAGTDWFYLPSITSRWQGRDEAGLRYWGLIEEAGEKRDDGGRAGWWRVTHLGAQFALDRASVPKYARIYDGRCLNLVSDEGSVTIRDALGTKFNYDDLMAGV